MKKTGIQKNVQYIGHEETISDFTEGSEMEASLQAPHTMSP